MVRLAKALLRLSTALVFAGGSLHAQATTTVADTLRLANGIFCGGTINVSYPTFYSSDGFLIQGGSFQIAVNPANGTFSQAMVPTNTAVTPYTGFYSAQYSLRPNNCASQTETWRVPIGGGTVNLNAVRTVPTPPPPLIPIGSISPAGGSNGQVICLTTFVTWCTTAAGNNLAGTARQIKLVTATGTTTFSLQTDLLLSGQSANNTDMLSGSRFTDSAPTGNFENFKSAAGGSLWQVSVAGVLGVGSIPLARVTGLGTGVATALGLAVSGTGAICLASGSACTGAGSGLTVGTTTITSGTTNSVEYNNAGVLGEIPFATTATANAIVRAGSGGTINANFVPTLNQNTTGNANTATDLATYPTLCTGTNVSQGLSSGSNNCIAQSGGGTSFGYFALVKTSSTVDTIGTDCSGSVPCNAIIRDSATAAHVVQITSSCTVTVSAGSATWSFYLDSSGNVDFGTSGTGTAAGSAGCNGPQVLAGGVLFPPGSVPLYTHTSLSGAWVSNGLTDYRSPLSSNPDTIGSGGILCSGNTCSPDSTVIGLLANSNSWSGTQTMNNLTVTGTCTGCGAGSTRAQIIPLEVGCAIGNGNAGNVWSWQTTNAPNGGPGSTPMYCPNSSDGYQGGFVAFSSANTNVAAVNIDIPSWWTAGTVTLNMWVVPSSGGTGNVQFQAATYCTTTSTVFGGGQTYNTANLTNLVTAPTGNHYYLLTATLTMTLCSGGSPLSILIQQTGSNTWSQSDNIGHSSLTFN